MREYFSVEWVAALRESGLGVAPDQVYSWSRPPVLGGDHAVENVSVADVEVHFSMLGQIHEQVRDLPPGTRIDRVKLSD